MHHVAALFNVNSNQMIYLHVIATLRHLEGAIGGKVMATLVKTLSCVQFQTHRC